MANFLDMLNDIGSRIRYGVDPTEKYRMLTERSVPGMPQPYLPTGEENPAATRFLSNYLGSQQWGEGPSELFNYGRYLLDRDPDLYQQGLEGQRAQGFRGQGFLSDILGDY